MRRRPAAIVAVASFALVFAPSISEAHDMTSTTSLTRSKVPNGPIDKSEKILLIGRLRSAELTCYAGLGVALYRKDASGERLVSRDETDAEGQYVFERRPRRDQTMYVRFPGLTQSLAGHSHVCEASTSKGIRIRIEA